MNSLSYNLEKAVELIYESSNLELPAAQQNYSADYEKIYLLKKAIQYLDHEIKKLEPPSIVNDPFSYGGKRNKNKKNTKTYKAKRSMKK
jgi:hypothetical protein